MRRCCIPPPVTMGVARSSTPLFQPRSSSRASSKQIFSLLSSPRNSRARSLGRCCGPRAPPMAPSSTSSACRSTWRTTATSTRLPPRRSARPSCASSRTRVPRHGRRRAQPRVHAGFLPARLRPRRHGPRLPKPHTPPLPRPAAPVPAALTPRPARPAQVGTLARGPLAGGALNPAAGVAAAVVGADATNVWAYLLATFAGAVLGAAAYSRGMPGAGTRGGAALLHAGSVFEGMRRQTASVAAARPQEYRVVGGGGRRHARRGGSRACSGRPHPLPRPCPAERGAARRGAGGRRENAQGRCVPRWRGSTGLVLTRRRAPQGIGARLVP